MTVHIRNDSSQEIRTIQVSPIQGITYGRLDLLGSSAIGAGNSESVDVDTYDAHGNCWLQIRAHGSDGRLWSTRMNVCAQSEWVVSN